uniref:Uncharacterized protein n=1 Tax=Oryza meridionalis TaxID=40149 RepID=A0A0E0DN25_9ORYZ
MATARLLLVLTVAAGSGGLLLLQRPAAGEGAAAAAIKPASGANLEIRTSLEADLDQFEDNHPSRGRMESLRDKPTKGQSQSRSDGRRFTVQIDKYGLNYNYCKVKSMAEK